MRATKNLSIPLAHSAKNTVQIAKIAKWLLPGNALALTLAVYLLLVTGLASAQTLTAYDELGNDDFGTINLTTAAFTETGDMGQLLSAIGVGPAGLLYGGVFEGTTLYQINPTNGTITSVGTSGFSYYMFASTTTGVYGFDSSFNLYSVNTTTAATTFIGSTGLSRSGYYAASTGSDMLYFAIGSPSALYTINTSTGEATEIGSTGVDDIGALVFENGTLYAGSDASPYALYTLDTSTGVATFVADTNASSDFWGLAPAVFPVVDLSSSSVKFASTLVGQTSASFKVTLTNTGSVSLSISNLSVSGDFSETDTCAGKTIAATGTCTVTLTFNPSITGSISGVLTIIDNAVNTPQVLALSGTGLPEISISPASEKFGTVTVGTTSAAKTVTVTNNTSGTLDYTPAGSSNFAAVGSGKTPCNGTLAAKKKCTLSVTFTPTANGAAEGSLTVASASFPTQLAALSGTGSGGGTSPLTFAPATFKVASTLVGASSSPVTVTVTNSSASPVNITNFAASADYSVQGSGTTPCSGTLGADASCTVAVTFTPSIAGTVKGSIVFMDNASVNTQLYDLSGTGLLPVTFSPASVSFATQTLGKTSAAKTVTLTNNQATALSLTSITASGQYSATAGGTKPCGSTVSAYASCTIEVTFTPAQAGTIPGAVTVAHNAAGSPQNVDLKGTGQ